MILSLKKTWKIHSLVILSLKSPLKSHFFMSPQGAVLSHKRKRKVQGKANALCCFALVICAACVCRAVVEVVALLGSIQRGLCGSSTARAIVDQVSFFTSDFPCQKHYFGFWLLVVFSRVSLGLKKKKRRGINPPFDGGYGSLNH